MARECVAKFLSIDNAENVVFTLNATYALNIAIKTTIKQGMHIIISNLEHNSVLRPVYKLARTKDVEFSVFDTEGDIEENIEKLIRKNTGAIISTLASNVTGKKISLSLLSKVARRHKIKLIVDASQLIGHEKIDLKSNHCDILCAPAHKALFGIQGLGFAVFCDKDSRESYIEGGSGIDSQNPLMPEFLPEHFEAGTLPTPAIVALRHGIEFIDGIGISRISKRIEELSNAYLSKIESIRGSSVYSFGLGIISFEIEDIPSSIVANELNHASICVRSGLHCAPLVHQSLKTDKHGLTRISLSYFNSEEDADRLYCALKEIRKKY